MMFGPPSRCSVDRSRRLLCGLLVALTVWSATISLETWAQTPPEAGSSRVQVSASPAASPASSEFLARRHMLTIVLVLVIVGGLVVLYVRSWGTQMTREVDKRMARLKGELEERTQSEGRLKADIETLDLALNAVDHGVVITDASGHVTRMNAPAEAMTGWSSADARGRAVEEIMPLVNPATRQPVDHPAIVAQKGQPTSEAGTPTVLRCRDGKERHVASTSTPLKSPDGTLCGTVTVFGDTTEQCKQEESLRQTQSLESVRRLASGVAHDFNNLLGGIIGFSEILLSRMPAGDRNREYVDNIIRAAQRSVDLTSKLLAFTSKGTVQSTPVDVHEIIREVMAVLDETLDRRIRIDRDLNASSGVILGDPVQLQNALLNLAMNARDAMPGGGTMTLSTANVMLDEKFCRDNPFGIKPGPYVEVDVADTGTGMSPDIMGKIFEPFFTTKKTGAGTGLGLSVVYGIVRDHHGAINLHSESGKGSLFRIYFPAATGATIAQPPKRSAQLVRGSGKILLVDDERVIRTVGDEMLSTMGYTVVTAENGLEAVKYVEEHPDELDLVILDVVMPKMNGHDAFLKLQKTQPGIKVVLSSGFAMGEEVKQLMEKQGLCGFVQKPYRAVPLSHQIADVIGRKA